MKNSTVVWMRQLLVNHTITTNKMKRLIGDMNVTCRLRQLATMRTGLQMSDNATVRLRDHANNHRHYVRLGGQNDARDGKA